MWCTKRCRTLSVHIHAWPHQPYTVAQPSMNAAFPGRRNESFKLVVGWVAASALIMDPGRRIFIPRGNRFARDCDCKYFFLFIQLNAMPLCASAGAECQTRAKTHGSRAAPKYTPPGCPALPTRARGLRARLVVPPRTWCARPALPGLARACGCPTELRTPARPRPS